MAYWFGPPVPKTVAARSYGGSGKSSIVWLAPLVGPLGLAPRVVLKEFENKTSGTWEGYKIDFVIMMDHPGMSKRFEIVLKPSVSTMILRASSYIPPSYRSSYGGNLKKGGYAVKTRRPEDRDRKYLHDGDIMVASVFAIAKQQRVWGRSQAAQFVGTIKEVLGSCHSLGITVDGMKAIKLQQAITKGEFTVPDDQSADEIETFLDKDNNPKPHLCKETFMTEEEKALMEEKARAKERSAHPHRRFDSQTPNA